eukprot:TRINITY_DN2079_c0_g1_i4.p1 TRINITY_DN2079_c0_g1~~TRINITY_DN2079_c0_g1_i4.p1  ORF type:complete len:412 (-),score=38.25 TRINITY_DN2079_c0_g1_i4:462-1664(-)
MSVPALFGSLKNLISPKSKGADISTNPFRLAKLFGVVLVACSILTTSKQFFGDPIQCKNLNKIPLPMFNSYCFMVGTKSYLAVNNRTKDLHVTDAHLGVTTQRENRVERTHSYYQWVPFILFFQAVLFYIPYRAWKNIEGGKLTKLLEKVSKDPLTEVSLTEQVQGLSNFLASNPRWFSGYAWKMFLCEICILLSAVSQMYLLDTVFDNQFFGYGSEIMGVEHFWEHYKIIEAMFPLVTSCEMKYISAEGTPNPDTGLCVLSINILNQKIFIGVWFILLAAIIFMLIKVVFNLALICAPSLRYLMLRSSTQTLSSNQLNRINISANYGFFQLLILIAQNVDSAQFDTLLTLIADKLAARASSFPSSPSSSIMMPARHDSEKMYPEDEFLKTKQMRCELGR